MEAILWISLVLGLGMFVFQLKKDHTNSSLLKSVTHKTRGTASERDLILKLRKAGYPSQTVYHDLYLENGRGVSAQIDVVIPTNEGIIVIEVKSYKGWIYGNGNSHQWTQVLNYGKVKNKLFNPIKQNEGHIRKLKDLSPQFQKIPFFSLIVFYGDCQLKGINYVPRGTFVLKSHRLFEVLNHIKKTNPVANYSNKKEVLQILQNATQAGGDIENQKKHVESVKDMLGEDRVFG